MDELDLFRGFRNRVAAPSSDVRHHAAGIVANEIACGAPRITGLGQAGRRSMYGVLIVATIVGATAAALLLTTPWRGSPAFLERAEAALTPPAGMILHETWQETSIPLNPWCPPTTGLNEIWIDETSPYRYRALLGNFPDPTARIPTIGSCSNGRPAEIGGTFDPLETIRFEPPNTLRSSPLKFNFPTDPVSAFRQALSAGHAHDEGTVQLEGRTVKRVRIDGPADCPHSECSREPRYVYVDPVTFFPIATEGVGETDGSGAIEVQAHIATQNVTFEYLRRTEANLALTDLRAQHPDALGP